MSPKLLLRDWKVRDKLLSHAFQDNMVAVAINEAHCQEMVSLTQPVLHVFIYYYVLLWHLQFIVLYHRATTAGRNFLTLVRLDALY